MAASDTVIGIIGAAVLVSVMVGVFVYEYNNTDDGDQATLDRVEFEAFYPDLDPDGDLDGDGTANWEDGDIDGDGVLNEEDETVGVTEDFEGDLDATSDTFTLPFTAQQGADHLLVTFEGSTMGLPLSQGTFTLRVLDEAGEELYSMQAADVAEFEIEIGPGDHTFEVTMNQGGLTGSISGELQVLY